MTRSLTKSREKPWSEGSQSPRGCAIWCVIWEATAGGSALAGETPLECALRELREETGIVSADLTQVGTATDPGAHAIYVEFLCVTDWDKDAVALQEGETVDFKWVSRKELMDMKRSTLVTERMQKFIEELKG